MYTKKRARSFQKSFGARKKLTKFGYNMTDTFSPVLSFYYKYLGFVHTF